MVHTPKHATAVSKTRPTRRSIGRNEMSSVVAPAPRPTEALSQPRPTGPTCRRTAMAGRSVTAPPKSTAKRSSEMAPRRIGVARTNRRPSSASWRPPLEAGMPSSSTWPTSSSPDWAELARAKPFFVGDPNGEDRRRPDDRERGHGDERHPHAHDVEQAAEDGADDGGGLGRDRAASDQPRHACIRRPSLAVWNGCAGARNACPAPKAMTRRKIGVVDRPWGSRTYQAMARATTAFDRAPRAATCRRSKRSTTCPATTTSRAAGANSASPRKPRASSLPVSS